MGLLKLIVHGDVDDCGDGVDGVDGVNGVSGVDDGYWSDNHGKIKNGMAKKFRGRRSKSLGHMNVMLRRRHPRPIFKYNRANSVASLLQFLTSSQNPLPVPHFLPKTRVN